MQALHYDEVDTPIGRLMLLVGDKGVRALSFVDNDAAEARLLARYRSTCPIRRAHDPTGISSHLLDYFGGDLQALNGIPADGEGTPFQRRVWAALRRIPVGSTVTYGALARQLDLPLGAARAVGLANARNPVALAVPCHRVIGAGGNLTGYAAGLPRKRWLLMHEGALPGSRTVADLFA